ncbi:hypothetical protein COLO4_14061 [Corchorus olitorius]|uniref:DAGKc domain-containing protein n=1 Tax=Corchorus olitorius TaxID=93759 RepID=A0A1R3JTU5_9ROSI|nr:hypothetical protein COLO4_14061 [Corchorus olitorius]
METNEGYCKSEDKSQREPRVEGEASVLSSNVFLDHAGEGTLTLHPDGLYWKPLDDGGSTCLGLKFVPKLATELKFSDIYAVELIEGDINLESVHSSAGECCLGHDSHDSEMNHFIVHSFQKSKSQPCLWILAAYTFGHKDLQACQMWVNKINDIIDKDAGRPKKLLVFVHPMSGKGNGQRTWDTVAPIFSCAKINTKVIVTQRAGHAFDVMTSTTNEELNSYDGAIAVGGDGFFNEILNGFLSRHKAPFPPAPSDFFDALRNDAGSLVVDQSGAGTETHHNEERHPLLPCSASNESGFCHLGTNDASPSIDKKSEYPLPNQRFRFGIIPAGSTDAIVICTTGARDPITSALHIVLGKRVRLDVAQVVRWQTTSTSKVEPCVRYAASFAGYGFYGDVITESEKYRWMGPKRYDYAGTKVFLRHRSYEAEVAYVEIESEKALSGPDISGMFSKAWSLKRKKPDVCRANCKVCNKKSICSSIPPYMHPQGRTWLKSKGRFLSVGAAIMSNRNERAPDGLVADAHLSDGFLHLLLIKDCPHVLYLWHLTQLARKGGNPLNFDFVEHYKTPAFTFTSLGKESVWNLDVFTQPKAKVLDRFCNVYTGTVWRLITNFFFLGPFSPFFAIRLIMIARYGVLLERGPFDKRTADFVWMLIFGALSLLVMSAVPFLWTPFMAGSLVFMIVYVWSREFPNAKISIYGLVTLKGFYLPWALLALDLIFGGRLMPDIIGMVAGHLYYFLTVLHPLAGGKYVFKTPLWVHKLVAYWGEGIQVNSPVQRDPSAGTAFKGRGYRLGSRGQTSRPSEQQQQQAQAQAPTNNAAAARQPNSGEGVAFRGKSYRLS